jgi:hypothetical protein
LSSIIFNGVVKRNVSKNNLGTEFNSIPCVAKAGAFSEGGQDNPEPLNVEPLNQKYKKGDISMKHRMISLLFVMVLLLPAIANAVDVEACRIPSNAP